MANILLPLNPTITAIEFALKVEEWLQYDVTVDEDREQTSQVVEQLVSADRIDLLVEFYQAVEFHWDVQEDYVYISSLLTCHLSEAALVALSQAIEIEFFVVVRGLIAVTQDDYITIALHNLDVLFPDVETIDKDAVDQLLEISKQERASYLLTSYLYALSLEKNHEMADMPSWIIPHPKGLLTHEELESELRKPVVPIYTARSVDEDIYFFCELAQVDNPDVDVEKMRKDLVEEWTGKEISASEREEVINYYLKNRTLSQLETDKELFRVYGACLMIPSGATLEIESEDPCQMHGGCRVWSCYHYNNWNHFTESELYEDPLPWLDELEWFTGKCSYCGIGIKKKCWAVRIPMKGGGWGEEPYHSFVCIRKALDPNDDVINLLVNQIEALYTLYGVYDRNELE